MGMIEPHDLSGHQIGKYRFIERIGRGGMAFVYRGEHVDFGLPIAIKVLFRKHSQSPEKRARFQREARLQFLLRHAHLVRTSDLIDDLHILGIVMDWVEGKDLYTYAQERGGIIPLETLQRIFLPVMDAVHYAHEHGVIHRDLKPSNILLEGVEGREIPKVLDFGIAKLLDDSSWYTQHSGVIGTPAYLSPEQCAELDCDGRSDVYALGVSFYQLATGRLPFVGETLIEILSAHKDRPAPPMRFWREGIPESIDHVIQKAIAKDPKERYQDCASFANALQEAFVNPSYPYIAPSARVTEIIDYKTEVALIPHTETEHEEELSSTAPSQPDNQRFPHLAALLNPPSALLETDDHLSSSSMGYLQPPRASHDSNGNLPTLPRDTPHLAQTTHELLPSRHPLRAASSAPSAPPISSAPSTPPAPSALHSLSPLLDDPPPLSFPAPPNKPHPPTPQSTTTSTPPPPSPSSPPSPPSSSSPTSNQGSAHISSKEDPPDPSDPSPLPPRSSHRFPLLVFLLSLLLLLLASLFFKGR